MHNVKLYYVRQVSTGYIIPRTDRGGVRGGSHACPCVPDEGSNETMPRFFRTEISARNFLSMWLKGRASKRGGHYESFSESKQVVWEACPERVKADMEIVSITVSL